MVIQTKTQSKGKQSTVENKLSVTLKYYCKLGLKKQKKDLNKIKNSF